jgi:hypothetical protein
VDNRLTWPDIVILLAANFILPLVVSVINSLFWIGNSSQEETRIVKEIDASENMDMPKRDLPEVLLML